MHGVPSGVPHTRPTPVHVQATDASLLPAGGATIANHMQFPAPLSTFVQIRLGQRGIGGLALLGAVPYYMSDTGSAQDQENIEKLVESNPEISHTVSNLEEHFDAWSGGDGAIPLAGMATPAAARDEDKSTKDIGDVIEAYLAQVSRAKAEELESVQRASLVDDSETPPKPDTLEDVLARVEARRKGKGPGPATPRHRA